MYLIVAALQQSFLNQPPLEIPDFIVQGTEFAIRIILGTDSRGEMVDRYFGAVTDKNGSFDDVL